MMARGAALKEVASSKLRRFLAYNKAIDCADVRVGNSALLFKAANRELMSWPGSARIPDIDETAVAFKFESQTF